MDVGTGVLPSQSIKELLKHGCIHAHRAICEDQIQPASIDLRLGPKAYQVRASFLPGKSSTIITKAKSLLVSEVDLTVPDPAPLAPLSVYIVPLLEGLALPNDVRGIANPKSTTGRLDIFTRLITERGDEFERVPIGYDGDLFVEVSSRTFPIRLKAGMRLNQLRFVRGDSRPEANGMLTRLLKESGMTYGPNGDDAGTVMTTVTVDLEGDDSSRIVAYKAKNNAPTIELNNINHYDAAEFWEPIYAPPNGRLILEPQSFYILASKQKVKVPPAYAAEMVPYDPAMGEFRVHYAGFFDPGFGFGVDGEIGGTKAVLEVRAYEMPILLEDNQLVGRLNYYRMADVPDRVYGSAIGSSYQEQGLALSKQFKRPGTPVPHSPHRPASFAPVAQ